MLYLITDPNFKFEISDYQTDDSLVFLGDTVSNLMSDSLSNKLKAKVYYIRAHAERLNLKIPATYNGISFEGLAELTETQHPIVTY